MAQKLIIYQVYYNNETRGNCKEAPFIVKHYNKDCSIFFENQIILDLINQGKHLEAEWFGVVSHKWLTSKAKGIIKCNLLDIPNRLPTMNNTVVGFHPNLKNGRIFSGTDEKYYFEIFNALLDYVGLPKTKPNRIIMQNHFLARSNDYQYYAIHYLSKAIEFLIKDKRAYKISPYKGYTYHTFLLEKLFNQYCVKYRLKVLFV